MTCNLNGIPGSTGVIEYLVPVFRHDERVSFLPRVYFLLVFCVLTFAMLCWFLHKQRESAIIRLTSSPSSTFTLCIVIPSGRLQKVNSAAVCYPTTLSSYPSYLDNVYRLMLLSPFIPLTPSATVATMPFSTSSTPFPFLQLSSSIILFF